MQRAADAGAQRIGHEHRVGEGDRLEQKMIDDLVQLEQRTVHRLQRIIHGRRVGTGLRIVRCRGAAGNQAGGENRSEGEAPEAATPAFWHILAFWPMRDCKPGSNHELCNLLYFYGLGYPVSREWRQAPTRRAHPWPQAAVADFPRRGSSASGAESLMDTA